ncbi:hypothetical protein EIP91_004030 [Steccherinum ochraceum]|uniref:Uncharacterized protein n=1 Tax=Steccherinum ochraceum TaxID=92696 RepID=A0A4R0RAU0_9APHY|nr:hypothetical protein EIP91_004030 [Steccherinum ochraceum]
MVVENAPATIDSDLVQLPCLEDMQICAYAEHLVWLLRNLSMPKVQRVELFCHDIDTVPYERFTHNLRALGKCVLERMTSTVPGSNGQSHREEYKLDAALSWSLPPSSLDDEDMLCKTQSSDLVCTAELLWHTLYLDHVRTLRLDSIEGGSVEGWNSYLTAVYEFTRMEPFLFVDVLDVRWPVEWLASSLLLVDHQEQVIPGVGPAATDTHRYFALWNVKTLVLHDVESVSVVAIPDPLWRLDDVTRRGHRYWNGAEPAKRIDVLCRMLRDWKEIRGQFDEIVLREPEDGAVEELESLRLGQRL